MARSASSTRSGRSVTPSPTGTSDTSYAGPCSAVVGVDGHQVGRTEALRHTVRPGHDDGTEVAGALVDLHETLLHQLEHGQEAYDHLDPLDEAGHELAERHPPRPAELGDDLGHR